MGRAAIQCSEMIKATLTAIKLSSIKRCHPLSCKMSAHDWYLWLRTRAILLLNVANAATKRSQNALGNTCLRFLRQTGCAVTPRRV
jgi:hypothetical protein